MAKRKRKASKTAKPAQTAKAPLPAPPPTEPTPKNKIAAKAAPAVRKAAIRRKADPDRPGRLQNGFGLPGNHLERALLTGESQGLLEDYFGPEGYQQLRDLSRDASSRGVRGGPRVYVLPGIMGSTLARTGALGLQNTLWVDPVEIALGHLVDLKLTGTPSIYHASGVILFSYLKLKLRLKIAGYDADFFPYDWRLSLTKAGSNLADAIRKDAASQVHLVAHSMGGLVSRAALATLGAAGKKVGKVVMLGTPNYGSFAPVEVMRGTYEVVNTIAKVDFKHTAEQLAGDVFNTFPGLYEMMPAPGKFDAINLYDAANWPKSGPMPRPQNLSAVKPVIDKLAGADDRFYLVAGVNQPTVTSLHVDQGEFVFDITPDGDGTVPLAFARLAGIVDSRTYYVEESHGSLPNHGGVESAVVDLLSTGVTQALPKDRPVTTRATRSVSESDLRAMAKQRAMEAGPLGSSDFRHLLDAVAAPPKPAVPVTAVAAAAAAAAGAPMDRSGAPVAFQNLVIGRRSQRRLELRLAKGSITDVDSQAYVLGIFRGVAPSGAAKAIDQRLDGAISEFTARRIFSGDVGELFTIPAGRSRLGADQVVFAGLGAFDHFNSDVQQLVAENSVRVLVRSRVDEFATVLIGAGSGRSTPAVLEDMLGGFLRGLRDADPHQRFRGITLCETDPGRYAEMKAALFNMSGTALFNDIELTLDEIELPPPSTAPARALAEGAEPVYVMIRQDAQSAGRAVFRVSILGSGMKAAVVSAAQNIVMKDLDAQLDKFDKAVNTASAADVRDLGKEFAKLVLPAEVCTVLSSMRDRHLVLVHDASASRIPWETLTVDNWSPSLTGGLSRRYLADDLPITTWLEQRRTDPTLKLLLIVNPLSDLDGAEKEGDRIVKLASGIDALEVTQLRGPQCTKPAVLAALRSGKYDIVHYAGHAFFDPKNPGRSGLFCTGKNVLTGADLLGLSNLPFLVFFNACEAGRVRGKPAPKPTPATAHAASSFGVAETLMRGGVANYMGTYWPVGDDAANTFASTFYQSLLAGSAIGAALLEGRKAVDKLAVRDWADYILYGSFDFILKPKKTE